MSSSQSCLASSKDLVVRARILLSVLLLDPSRLCMPVVCLSIAMWPESYASVPLFAAAATFALLASSYTPVMLPVFMHPVAALQVLA